MNDAIGQTIEVGDTLFYGQLGRYPQFVTCKVVKTTPKSVVANIITSDRPYSNITPEVRIYSGSHCIKINKLLVP